MGRSGDSHVYFDWYRSGSIVTAMEDIRGIEIMREWPVYMDVLDEVGVLSSTANC